MICEEKLIAILRLINTPKVGYKSFYNLINDFGSAEKAIENLEKNSKSKPWSIEEAKAEIAKAKKENVVILTYLDEEYPNYLREFDDMPPVLYVKGNLETLNYNKSVAIVGSRAASINGRKTASRIAHDLTENDVCVVSGMAKGIDAAAHKGALYAFSQTGKTIAVLGTGVDVIYPPENKELYEQICKNGCIISEFALGSQANPKQFPRRNKTVCALSDAVLVVEAGAKSGSLITAEFAIDMKKTLFAVPGTPGESRSTGSNLLIKRGANLVDCADDILPFLKGNKEARPIKKEQAIQKSLVFENNDVNYSEQEKAPESLVDFLTVDGVDIDELIRLSGKTAQEVFGEILELELSGVAERLPGNKIALTGEELK